MQESAQPETTTSTPTDGLEVALSPTHAAAASAAPTRATRRPGALREWLRLTHPAALPFGLAPVAATLAYLWATGTSLAAAPAVLATVALLLVLAGAYMLDDYFELERCEQQGLQLIETRGPRTGPVLAETHIPRLDALRAGSTLLAVGALVGLPLIQRGGLPVALLGALGLAAAALYSASRYALKLITGSEVVILLLAGPGIAATITLTQRAQLTAPVLLLGLGLGLALAAVLESGYLASYEPDQHTGRRTLAVALGPHRARWAAVAAMGLAYVCVLAAAVPRGAPHGALVVLLALPAAVVACSGVLSASTPAARALLGRQALHAFVLFACWLIAGLLATGLTVELVRQFAVSLP
jgi:1,4-dihydroxy-2-naphthoate octaprenyltransferase